MNNILSLYIHIPFCISKCKYCDFFSVPCKEVADDYILALCREIVFRIKEIKTDYLKSIYIGGGTPSLLKKNQLEKLFDTIKNNVRLTQNCEITIEVNPDDITLELLQVYDSLGINRISCGIQSMTDSALKFAGRRASREINLQALDNLKEWKGRLSLDLISGLPEETTESFLESVEQIISANPDHISMYELTLEEETPFGKLFLTGEKEYDSDYSDNLWLEAKKVLIENGYYQYEVSNFAKSGCECKHNMTYWNHEDYLGCGSGGTGTVYNSDGTGIRWTNDIDIKRYITFWNETFRENDVGELPQFLEQISMEDSIFEFFMMGLRKIKGIKISDYREVFKNDIPDKIHEELLKWNEKGLCQIYHDNEDCVYTLGENGILYLNQFLENIL